jgi:hypothetical protein
MDVNKLKEITESQLKFLRKQHEITCTVLDTINYFIDQGKAEQSSTENLEEIIETLNLILGDIEKQIYFFMELEKY